MTRPLVTVETTAGDLVLELSPDDAPKTVANFLAYVKAGFYAGTVFHRVIPRFVAQAGGYTPSGARKPPILPPIRLESSPLRHTDGAVGMARLPDPHTATSEFYVTDGAQKDLDVNYVVFGKLVDGRDALHRILGAPTKPGDWPVDPPVILRAYEGRPDAANPTPKYEIPKPAAVPAGVEAVRAAARKLKGRAAMLRARRPLLAMAEVENAIAAADRSGKPEDLQRAESMLVEKERR